MSFEVAIFENNKVKPCYIKAFRSVLQKYRSEIDNCDTNKKKELLIKFLWLREFNSILAKNIGNEFVSPWNLISFFKEKDRILFLLKYN